MLQKKYNFLVSSDLEYFKLIPGNPFICDYSFIDRQNLTTKIKSATLYEDNEPIISALLEIDKSEVWLLKHSTFGMLNQFTNDKMAIKYFMFNLVEWAQKENVTEIYIKLPSLSLFKNTSIVLQESFNLGFALMKTEINTVIVNGLVKLTKGRKSQIKKAAKLGTFNFSEKNLESAEYDLLLNNLAKHNANPLHSLDKLREMSKIYGDKVQFHKARLKDTIESIIITFDYGCTIHTQYIASSLDGQKKGLQDMLLYTLINQAIEQKKNFSFGISNEPENNNINYGLLSYKSSFGGYNDLKFTIKKSIDRENDK